MSLCLGRKYRLRIVEDAARQRVIFKGDGRLELHVSKGTNRDARERRLSVWYRDELKAAIPGLISAWAPVLEVDEPTWVVRRMKTKWGTCKPDQVKIWLNLELAKKSPECLEYIVVHEMVHLLERNHAERFYDLRNRFAPHWRMYREELNRAPLADEDWTIA